MPPEEDSKALANVWLQKSNKACCIFENAFALENTEHFLWNESPLYTQKKGTT